MVSGRPEMSSFAKYMQGVAKGQTALPTTSNGPSRKQPAFVQKYLSNMGSYSVGNRTYNGSSPSPHAGPGGVNPAGYATRENQANTKREGLLKFINQRNY